MDKKENKSILYSCYHTLSRQGENFVPQHTVSLQLAGSFVLNDGKEQYRSEAGQVHLIRKNQLVKFTKCPPPKGDFESLNIFLDDETLRSFANDYHVTATHQAMAAPMIAIEMNDLLQHYFASIQAMIKADNLHNHDLIAVKIKELILLLIQAQPELKNILFDFSEPHKIDLEAFMNQNFRFNVNLERFAYLTGRSLATFKRDFTKIFDTSPHQWILQKRLNEAHYLLQKSKTASDIYLDLGFEDLSHFSYVFKKKFGYSPANAELAYEAGM